MSLGSTIIVCSKCEAPSCVHCIEEAVLQAFKIVYVCMNITIVHNQSKKEYNSGLREDSNRQGSCFH
jgi:hypothetical protein